MHLATAVATGISSAAFAGYGATCLFSRGMVSEFERYRLGAQRQRIGALQLAGSAGLLAGFVVRPLLLVSALALALMMVVAVLVRVRIRDPFVAALPALVLLALNLYIAWGAMPGR